MPSDIKSIFSVCRLQTVCERFAPMDEKRKKTGKRRTGEEKQIDSVRKMIVGEE